MGSVKHTPYIRLDGSAANVLVGRGAITDNAENIHPMVASGNPSVVHFVSFMYVLDEQGQVVAMTPKFPDDDAPAALAFTVPDAKTLTPFEFCNKHGLYVGPTVDMNGDTLETTLLGTIAPIVDNQISTRTVTTRTGTTTLTTTTILTTTITTSTLTTVTTTRTTMQSVSGFSVSDLD